MKRGDYVKGPSMMDAKIRTWRILAVGTHGDMAAVQNVAARRPYRHIVRLSDVEQVDASLVRDRAPKDI